MQALTILCNSIYYNHKILVITYISELSKLNWGAFHNCLHKSGFILERSLAGFLQLRKKCQIKFTLPRQMGHRQNRPKNKIFFEVKVSKTSLTTTLIWRPLYKLSLNFYSLSLSQLLLFFVWVIISPDKHLGLCRNSSPGFFSCPECSKMAAKRPTSPTHVECQTSQKAPSFFSFLDLVPPFLDPLSWKRAPKITEGPHLTPEAFQ